MSPQRRRSLGFIMMLAGIAYVTHGEESGARSGASSGESGREASRVSGINVMQAFLSAYPDKVRRVTYRNQDWAAETRDGWFYWADGKLLPESELDDADRYSRHSFYRYTDHLPMIQTFQPEEKIALQSRISARERSPIGRHPGLFNSIWRIVDKPGGWDRVKTVFFLGKKVLIHRELLEDLAAVEEEILSLMQTDEEIGRYMSSIELLEGFNWRAIAGTVSLSLHSYGIAIDFIPSRTGGKETYWRWARDRSKEWFSLPYEERFMPPAKFIRAFEKRGFIWGGKWFYFDTIHFEYRPEILALNGYRRIVADQPGPLPVEEIWVPPTGLVEW